MAEYVKLEPHYPSLYAAAVNDIEIHLNRLRRAPEHDEAAESTRRLVNLIALAMLSVYDENSEFSPKAFIELRDLLSGS
jgi:hypothetical protein